MSTFVLVHPFWTGIVDEVTLFKTLSYPLRGKIRFRTYVNRLLKFMPFLKDLLCFLSRNTGLSLNV
jgi:hypothetical protein